MLAAFVFRDDILRPLRFDIALRHYLIRHYTCFDISFFRRHFFADITLSDAAAVDDTLIRYAIDAFHATFSLLFYGYITRAYAERFLFFTIASSFSMLITMSLVAAIDVRHCCLRRSRCSRGAA